MKSFRRRATLPLCLLAGIAACSNGDGGTGPTVPDLSCSPGPAPTVMNAGEYRILNPNLSEGCLRLPAAAASGAEYLVAALSTANARLLLRAGADPQAKTEAGRDVLSLARKVRADELAGEISLWILKGCSPEKPC